jgi:hypothetical protein
LRSRASSARQQLIDTLLHSCAFAELALRARRPRTNFVAKPMMQAPGSVPGQMPT